MPIEIRGQSAYSSESDALQDLVRVLATQLRPNDDATLVAGAKCWGERRQDLDLLALISFASRFQVRIPIDGSETPVFLSNLALLIEVKSHPPEAIRIEAGNKVLVRYHRDDGSVRWEDATEQLSQQMYSLSKYCRRCALPGVFFVPLLWLRNLPSSYLPKGPHNVLPSDLTFERLIHTVAACHPPSRFGKPPGYYAISCCKLGNERAVAESSHHFLRRIEPTPLDRKRLERITLRLVRDQKYADRLGQQLLIFRGLGGSGKTVHLLRLAHELARHRDQRILLLTYNRALAADIRRLLAILGYGEEVGSGRIIVQTALSFFAGLLGAWDMWKLPEEGFTDANAEYYEKQKNDLCAMLQEMTPAQVQTESPVATKAITSFDYILVDEGQDWPENERDLLYATFGPTRCVVADGVNQLVRRVKHTSWRLPGAGVPDQVVPLRRAMRMKSNLCRFVLSFAEQAELDFDLEVNDELPGGSVLLLLGRDYDHAIHKHVMQDHARGGNAPVDALFCTSAEADDGPLASQLMSWGYEIWDGTKEETRLAFPTSNEAHRVIRYQSARGLEGWTVVCLRLDAFFDATRRAYVPGGQLGLLDSKEEEARRWAFQWCLIPLTRAIDRLVLQVQGGGFLAETFLRVSEGLPGVVTVIR